MWVLREINSAAIGISTHLFPWFSQKVTKRLCFDDTLMQLNQTKILIHRTNEFVIFGFHFSHTHPKQLRESRSFFSSFFFWMHFSYMFQRITYNYRSFHILTQTQHNKIQTHMHEREEKKKRKKRWRIFDKRWTFFSTPTEVYRNIHIKIFCCFVFRMENERKNKIKRKQKQMSIEMI